MLGSERHYMWSCEPCTIEYQRKRAALFQEALGSRIHGSRSALVRSPAPLEPVTPPKATGMAYFIQQPMSSTVAASSGSASSGSASSSGDMATGSTSASSGSGFLMDLD